MNYWLLKSEPSTWSWNDQKKSKKTMWDGVRNYQARNYMMQMKKNDMCFFYHSVKEKQIVGIVKVIKEHYPDPTDSKKKFVAVDVEYYKIFSSPVTLQQIKFNNKLSNILLLKQSRLSVMPINKKFWNIICKMGKI